MRLLVNIDVDGLERAIEFYTTALGLTLARRLFDGSVAELSGAGVPLYLIDKPAGTRAAPVAATRRRYSRHWTPVHLDFTVDDVSAAVTRAIAAGAALEGRIRAFDWGRLATMSDPFGHGFCLIQFNAQGYDAAAVRA